MHTKGFGWLLVIVVFALGCASKNRINNPPISTSTIHRQSCSSDLGFSGSWRLVNIKDSGKNNKPKVVDTIFIVDCKAIERHSAGRVTKQEFKLYKMTNYCADYQLVYTNDSLGCINIVKDTLIFSECSDFETTRYFFKRIAG